MVHSHSYTKIALYHCWIHLIFVSFISALVDVFTLVPDSHLTSSSFESIPCKSEKKTSLLNLNVCFVASCVSLLHSHFQI